MDTRTLIAFGLILLIYFYFFQPKPDVRPPAGNQIGTSDTVKTDAEVHPKAAAPSTITKTSNSLKLKSYELRNSILVVKVDGTGSVQAAEFPEYKQGVKTDEKVKAQFEPKPLDDASLKVLGSEPNFAIVGTPTSNLLQLRAVQSESGGDAEINKKVELREGEYFLRVTYEIRNQSKQTIKSSLDLTLNHPPIKVEQSTSFLHKIFYPQAEIHEAVASHEGSIIRETLGHLKKPIQQDGLFSWAGYTDKYFFYGAVPQNITFQTFAVESDQEGLGAREKLSSMEKQIAAGENSTYEYFVYAGPKDISELEKANPDLPKVINYGSWIGPISRVLLSLLHFFYSLIANYGIAIILLTILVKAVLFPLAWKSAVSMRKLQVVQPKMKAIRDRYKDDKNRMNVEMMALYRAEKVNPVGGCLPLLIQMPVFFALYRVFFASIELRHAPFFGWIQDLSAYDPFFVTPVLMTGLMWFQQKLTPQPPGGDDNEAARVQRAMLKWMPLIFGSIMIFLPAGLTLYFLVNALLSIVQQIYLNRHLGIKFPDKLQAVSNGS